MADGYGYRRGMRQIVRLPLDSSSADIIINDGITAAGATSGFFKEVDAAAEKVVGFATGSVLSPSTDGDAHVLVDVSNESVYELPPDAGTVSYALVGRSCDIGANGRSADIDGSSDDSLQIVDVSLERNTVYVQLRSRAAAAGVA